MDNYGKASESADDYLKTIFILSQDNSQPVRVTDIARLMGYTKASVSRAVRNLLFEGKISLTPNKRVVLTPDGLSEAKGIYEKNRFFRNILVDAGVDEKTADDEACKMEHALCVDSFEKLKRHLGGAVQEPCD
ncbi:metal-dependent transcriptional regulator [Ruminococcus sp. FC2018]|uniref:metal-dependent transcriptional regulator n=1 Tax=Ruminococcus sp. FC2018 TaxID=1410617 RepID=UPI000491A2AA|nr:metal-dependent transcriptional regulator [Ruminococcus sp. FC2018]